MGSTKLCPGCYADTLERQPKNVYLPTNLKKMCEMGQLIKVKPWICSHCGIVLFYKVEES